MKEIAAPQKERRTKRRKERQKRRIGGGLRLGYFRELGEIEYRMEVYISLLKEEKEFCIL